MLKGEKKKSNEARQAARSETDDASVGEEKSSSDETGASQKQGKAG